MTFQQLSTKSAAGWIQDNGSRLLRIATVLAVIAVSVAAPFVLSGNRIILLLGLTLAIAGVWLIMRWPAFGLLILVVAGLVVPSPFLPGGLNVAVMFLGLLIVLWLVAMIAQKRVALVSSRPIRPLLALLLVTCVSFGFGQLGWFSFAQTAPLDAQIGGLFIFILSVGAFLLAAHQLNVLWLQVLSYLFILLGALFVLGWLVPAVGAITGKIFQQGAISNSMFWTWLVALAFSQALFNRKLPIGWRILFGLIVVMTLYVGYIKNREWKSGYLPAFVAIVAIISARSWRIGLAIALLSVFPAIFFYNEAVATDEYSYSTRLDAFLIMVEMIRVSPLLGFGPSNYYWYTPLFRIRGYAVQFNSHNQYFDITAQSGILGLICFLWFGVEMAWLSLKLRNDAPEGFAQAYVYGAIGGLAGTFAAAMLADWVIPFTYNIGFTGMRGSILAWIFLGGVVAIEQITYRQAKLDSSVKTIEPTGATA